MNRSASVSSSAARARGCESISRLPRLNFPSPSSSIAQPRSGSSPKMTVVGQIGKDMQSVYV